MNVIELASQLYAAATGKYGDARRSALIIYGIPEELIPLADELCTAYANASPEECRVVRDTIAKNGALQAAFLGNVYRAARAIHSSSDLPWLHNGLASASIENCSSDYRDWLLALAELYVIAERAGLDVQSESQFMALRSDAEMPQGGNTPVQVMLRDFGKYAVLHERRMKKN